MTPEDVATFRPGTEQAYHALERVPPALRADFVAFVTEGVLREGSDFARALNTDRVLQDAVDVALQPQTEEFETFARALDAAVKATKRAEAHSEDVTANGGYGVVVDYGAPLRNGAAQAVAPAVPSAAKPAPQHALRSKRGAWLTPVAALVGSIATLLALRSKQRSAQHVR